ncbi:hypothetical protein ACIHEI_21195 [Kitasatospora sp. NPDC051984]|uniref:hypothetical protein n=1 Tax=Kitasatospora sp. NPDC051984 TaxID=3364059 RepID=UPI0037C7D713
MADFLGELGKKLAERWIAMLAVPGALYLAVAFGVAGTLGHAHALDGRRLVGQVEAWARSPLASGTAGQAVLLVALLLGAAAAGLVAQALGSALEVVALSVGWRDWWRPARALAGHLMNRRLRRWNAACARYRAGSERGSEDAYRAWSDIAVERPDRPFWTGDRLNATAIRLQRETGVYLPVVWPALWPSLPASASAELTAARADFSRAAALGGWAALYAMLAVWWWPAAPLAVGIALTARHRLRTAAATNAVLQETMVRRYAAELARDLGLTVTGPLSKALGTRLSAELSTSTTAVVATADPVPVSRVAGSVLDPASSPEPHALEGS